MAEVEPMSPTEYFASLCGTVATRVELRLEEDTPLEVARAILMGLPRGWRIIFYDRDYPSGSDPGGYVTVDRQGRRYRLRRTNHGWTSRWEEATSEEAAAYLHRCRRHQDPYRPYDNLVALVRERPAASRPPRPRIRCVSGVGPSAASSRKNPRTNNEAVRRR